MRSVQQGGETYGFLDLITIVWERKFFIGFIVLVCVVIAAIYSLLLTPVYRSEALLRPARDVTSGSNELGAGLGGLAKLGAIAGLGSQSADVEEAVAILNSRSFTMSLLLEDGFIYKIYDEFWDADAQKWRSGKETFLSNVKKKYREIVESLATAKTYVPPATSGYSGPSLEEAVDLFEVQVRNVSLDRRTGFVRLSIDWKDPVVARDWIVRMISRLNEETRRQAVQEAETTLRYLREAYEREENQGLRSTMLRLFEGQLEKAMVAEVKKNFSLEYIDEPFVPEQRVKPRRTLIVVVTFLVSFVMASALAVFRHAMAVRKRLRLEAST